MSSSQILVRRLPRQALQRLKARARRAGCSMEEEARRILTGAVGAAGDSWHERADRLRARIAARGSDQPSSTAILRELRQAREDAITPPRARPPRRTRKST